MQARLLLLNLLWDQVVHLSIHIMKTHRINVNSALQVLNENKGSKGKGRQNASRIRDETGLASLKAFRRPSLLKILLKTGQAEPRPQILSSSTSETDGKRGSIAIASTAQGKRGSIASTVHERRSPPNSTSPPSSVIQGKRGLPILRLVSFMSLCCIII